MPIRFEIYTPIHKGLRRGLSMLAIKASKLDYENKEALSALCDKIRTHAAPIDVHHSLEERVIHPLLNANVLGAQR